jgi:DNA-binding response OmpR family regulator
MANELAPHISRIRKSPGREVLDFCALPKCAMESPPPNSVVRFGTYEVSLQSGEVRKSGLRIRVQQQPMKLLEILLEHAGEVVTREELRSRVWPRFW